MTKLLNFKDLSAKLKLGAATGALVSSAFVVFSLPTTAIAQDGAAGALLEEIVTTARKRSEAEAVQDVPIAVSAYGAVQLDALFVKKIDDLSYLMPNVQLEAVGTFPGVQNFSIRGQGINSSIPSVDPTVGVFVDGIYMGTTYGVVIDTFDLESVEVLRGPQGLLFGRDVTGGAVVIRNARPNGESGVRVRAGMTDNEQYNIAAALEGSLVQDKLAGKIVVYYDDNPGYFKNTNQTYTGPQAGPFPIAPAPYPTQSFYINPASRTDVGAMTTKLVRPTLVWTPTDYADVTLIVEQGESKGDGAVWTNVTAQRAGTLPNFTTSADELGFTDMKWSQVSLEVNIDGVGNGTLTNVAGYRRVAASSATDVDGTYFPLFTVPGSTGQMQWSNELRWAGQVMDGWDTTAGLYYFIQDVNYREGRYISSGALRRALGGDMDDKNFGVFWNNDFMVTDDFSMSIGFRYTDESKSTQIISGVGGGCADVVNYNCNFDALAGEWTYVTPKIGFQWQLNDTSQMYSFWAKGFRSGGFNFRNAKPNVIPPGPTKEEENTTIEIGYKSEFRDGRVRLNAAIFHNEIQDMQRELNLGDPDVVVLQGTINAGDVTIWGIEVDFVTLITDNFSFSASYGHQEGNYDRVNPNFASFLGPDLPRLAPDNYSVGLSYDVPLNTGGLINFATNYSFRDKHPYNDSNTEIFSEQKRLNVSANWYLPNDAWQISLYGKNLQDEANWGNLTSISGIYTAGPMQEGRIYGIEVNYRQ